MIRWGFGNPNQNQNQGYWQFCAIDVNVDFSQGVVTLAYENHSRHTYIPIEEKADTMLHGNTVTTMATAMASKDKNSLQALPEGGSTMNPAIVGQDSRLVIDYLTLVAATAVEDCQFNIPITKYD